MPVPPDVRDEAAQRLREAVVLHTPTTAVRDLIGDDAEAAYAVQQVNIAERLRGGARVVGRKIGLTSPAVQAQLGVDQPDFGVLLDDMEITEAELIPTTTLLQPKIEAEVAFILGADLVATPDGDITMAAVRDAIIAVAPALEIVDSRIAGWDITFADTVADNASSGLFVLGQDRATLDDVEPVNVTMSMTRNGEEVSTGSGAACLGDPLAAVRWLARTAAELGDPLRAGQVILSGALGPMSVVTAGDVVTATISGLGKVTARFSTEARS